MIYLLLLRQYLWNRIERTHTLTASAPLWIIRIQWNWNDSSRPKSNSRGSGEPLASSAKTKNKLAHIAVGIPFVAIRNSFIALCVYVGPMCHTPRYDVWNRACGIIFRWTNFIIFMIVCRSKNIYAFGVCRRNFQINGEPSQPLSLCRRFICIPSFRVLSHRICIRGDKIPCVCVCSDPMAAFRIDVDIGSSRWPVFFFSQLNGLITYSFTNRIQEESIIISVCARTIDCVQFHVKEHDVFWLSLSLTQKHNKYANSQKIRQNRLWQPSPLLDPHFVTFIRYVGSVACALCDTTPLWIWCTQTNCEIISSLSRI